MKILSIKVKYIRNKNVYIKLLRIIKNIKNNEFIKKTYLEMIMILLM